MSLLYVTGIVEDGSARDAHMPRDTATTLHLPVGASAKVRLRLFYPSGVPVLTAGLTAGWLAQLDVCCGVDPCQKLPDFRFTGEAVVGDFLGNAVEFSIPAGTFRGRQPGRYYFDVWLVVGVERWQVVGLSALVLEAGLLRP